MAMAGGSGFSVLFWNIRQGGGRERAQGVLLRVIESDADVVCLAECTSTFGGQMIAELRGAGWRSCVSPDAAPDGHHVAIASRLTLSAAEFDRTGRIVTAGIPEAGASITAAHVPDPSRRRDRLAAMALLVRDAAARRDEAHLIIGDLNADRDRASARDRAGLGRLAALGYSDLWLASPGPNDDATWAGPRGERGRIDHAHASAMLAARLDFVAHLHAPRHDGLSDHSLIEVAFRDAPG
jgi:endonuclease/exonuclease/phosphatase family metal-dependent hydrolase